MTPSPNPETDFAYEPLPDGTVRIVGLNVWYYRDLDTVVIPAKINGKSVVEIDDEAFMLRSSLTSVVIPKGVKEIKARAFANCSSLTSVVISEGVKNIGKYAFSCCSSLTSVVIPKSVKEIGKDAFKGRPFSSSVGVDENR